MQRVALALDLGGTQMRAAVVDEQARVVNRLAVATAHAAGPAAIVEQLTRLANAVSDGISRDRICGVGVSAAGPVDTERGIARCVGTLAELTGLPLRTLLKTYLELPVWLENDGVAAAIGEWRFGAGRAYSNVVYVTVSTGIGGGVISDGHVVRGRLGMAGHVGHMTIVRDGIACACGNSGCWETYGSGTAFAQRARANGYLDGAAVFIAADAGDRLATALVNSEAEILGAGITNLLHLYSPDIVIIGGGMSTNFNRLYPGMVGHIQSTAMEPFRDVPIVRAELEDNAGLIGASHLVFASLH